MSKRSVSITLLDRLEACKWALWNSQLSVACAKALEAFRESWNKTAKSKAGMRDWYQLWLSRWAACTGCGRKLHTLKRNGCVQDSKGTWCITCARKEGW